MVSSEVDIWVSNGFQSVVFHIYFDVRNCPGILTLIIIVVLLIITISSLHQWTKLNGPNILTTAKTLHFHRMCMPLYAVHLHPGTSLHLHPTSTFQTATISHPPWLLTLLSRPASPPPCVVRAALLPQDSPHAHGPPTWSKRGEEATVSGRGQLFTELFYALEQQISFC